MGSSPVEMAGRSDMVGCPGSCQEVSVVFEDKLF